MRIMRFSTPYKQAPEYTAPVIVDDLGNRYAFFDETEWRALREHPHGMYTPHLAFMREITFDDITPEEFLTATPWWLERLLHPEVPR